MNEASQPPPTPKKGLSTGAIVGIVALAVGIPVLLVCAGAVSLFYLRFQSAPEPAPFIMNFEEFSSESPNSVTIDSLEIRIEASGVVIVNDEVVETAPGNSELPNLRARLEIYSAAAGLAGATPLVIVESADGAKSGRFVDVMKALGDAGIDNVTLKDYNPPSPTP